MAPLSADTPTWGDRYRWAREQLGADHEARWLVEEASGGTLPADSDRTVGERSGARFEQMVQRRVAGEPLQYVLGHWAFRTLDLMVDRRVLIPRPETEQVVEVALEELRTLSSGSPQARIAVDLGTGSGAIALSLAAEGPAKLEVWATDRFQPALSVARANLAGLGGRAATKVSFALGEWWDALPRELAGRIDLAVSNPPYVSTAEMASLDDEVVAWEPATALEAGPDGMEDVARIVDGAGRWLAPHAVLVVEIAPRQAERAMDMARAGGFADVGISADLSGRLRALVAKR